VVEAVVDFGKQAKWRYAEWRGADIHEPVLAPYESYFTHDIDLTRPEAQIFSSLSPNNRRNINKAVKDGITVEFEVTQDSLRHFYRLNCITRKRHGLPPQPFSFFKKFQEHILSQGYGTIAVARHQGTVAAAAVFLHFGKSAIYKYGASNPRYQGHRPNNLIMWEAARRYKAQGSDSLNLGRTEVDNAGLLRFKRSWGAAEKEVGYQRYRYGSEPASRRSGKRSAPARLVSLMPIFALRILGRLLYKHAA
jgi:lipid II:glycine glycyltransferase (peptidoglycan interpeptide bridge formation enzyme)